VPSGFTRRPALSSAAAFNQLPEVRVEGVPWMDDTDAIGPSCGGATFIIGFMFFQIDRLVLEDEDEASPGAHVVVLAIENLNNFIFLIVAN
jgi:hypothetical protein